MEDNTIEIIYADHDIIVVNKPPGISVHGGDSVSGPTVADMLADRFPELRHVGDDPVHRPGIVHRLDRDTSGVMAVARNQESFLALKKLFAERQVEKIYVAIVCGSALPARGVISLPIGRLAKNPRKRGVGAGRSVIRGERAAITEYRTLKKGGGFSLLELAPKTGRMHQLRVHLKALGSPIACDRLYGGKNVCCPAGAARHLLHAKSLSFTFPQGRRMRFEADLPSDFAAALGAIIPHAE